MFAENFITILLIIITTFNNGKLSSAAELQHVFCNKDFVTVQLPVTSNHSNLPLQQNVYWQNLHTSSEECQPVYHQHEITFMIWLENAIKCGFQRTINKLKTQITLYQDLILEEKGNIKSKLQVKCSYKTKSVNKSRLKHKLVKRSVLPADFQEEIDIEILETIEQKASEPRVLMEVRQNGEVVNDSVIVVPGTPLLMEIKLNEDANEVYDLKINNLEVTDTAEMSETILFRGCTVDPYLFENFNLSKPKSLQAKFRAFKFPNTAFVEFRANVQICLKKCPTTPCLAGGGAARQRSRRQVTQQENFYQAEAAVVLKFSKTYLSNEAESQSLQNHLNLLHIKNLQLHNIK